MDLPSDFVSKQFTEYYKRDSSHLQAPSNIESREFGFLISNRTIMIRHKKFKTRNDLRSFFLEAIPSDAYYSSAYYENPEAEMGEKGWVGADLIFDIDADHILTPCGKVHDIWACCSCGFAGRGRSPQKCPVCSEAKFDVETWMCEECLESAKKETFKLLDMLMKDFGFQKSEIKLFFSGNRGYHVHIENEQVHPLDSTIRKEIVDYVIGLGFQESLHRIIEGDKLILEENSGDAGWKPRITKGTIDFLTKATKADGSMMELGKNAVDHIVNNRKTLLDNIESYRWLKIKGVGVKNWRKIIQKVADIQSAKVDTVVTTDVHRLIRLPGSLHGKTGLLKFESTINGLDHFDPLNEAVAFRKGDVSVDINRSPKFRIGNESYGPFNNSRNVLLPTAAALFLACKGAVQAVKPNV